MKLDIQKFAVTFTGKEVTGNYSWAKIQGRVICEETYVGTSAENKSTVKCTVQARVTTGGTTAANWRAGATVGGDAKTGKLTTNTKFTDSWKTIKEFTFDVPHDEDGSKVVAISGYAQAPEYATSLGDAKSTFSGTMTLTTIPRESSISVNKETATLGDTIRVTIDRKSSSFSENLTFILSSPDTGSQNVEAVGVSDTYYDYVITEETYKYLTGTQGFLTISGTTLDGNDKVVASTNTVSVEILTPDSMIPSVEIGDLYENGTIVPSSWGVFVKGKSEIGVPVTSTGVNGSTIKNISMKDSNDSGVYVINGSSGIFSTNKVKSNGTLTITATDTRVKSTSKTVGYEVVDYANPILSTYSAKKVNSEGTEDDNGQYIMFSIGGTVSSCGGNNVKKLYVAVNNQTNWISVADDTVDTILSDITIDPNVKNTVYFKIEDNLGGSEIKSVPIDSAFRLMNFNKTLTSVAVGKKSSAADNEELLEVDMDSKFYKDIETTNVVSRNLYNKNDTYRIGSSYQNIANDISLKPNTSYCFKTGKTWTEVRLYDSEGVLTRSLGGSEGTTEIRFNTSSNEVKGQFIFYIGKYVELKDFTGIQLEEGIVSSEYVPYLNLQEIISKYTELKDTELRVSNVVSKNFFNAWNYNYENDVNGCSHSINNTNKITFNVEAGWARKKVILKLKPNNTYTISSDITNNNGYYCGFWNNSSKPLSTANAFKSKLTFTTDDNGEFGVWFYCNFSDNKTVGQVVFDNIQLEENAIATDYVPYLNLEEAMQKEEIYSTSEQRIGTWIDGKPLYRRVIHLQNIDLGSANEYVIHDISNYEVVFVPKYFIYNAVDINGLRFKMVESTSYEVSANNYMHILAFQNNLLYQSNMWKYIEYGYVVIEYTKTID